MKKNYFFTLILMVFALCSVNAQFTDDFESYPLGSYHGGHWSAWGGTAGGEDIIVSNAYAFDGTQSGLIAGSGTQDALLILNNATSGIYNLSFQVYIPVGKSGYMNFQGTATAAGGVGNGGNGIFNSPNLIFNNVLSPTGAAGLGGAYPNVEDATPTYTWTFPHGEWFPIEISFDLDNALWTLSVNGIALNPQPFAEEAVLGAIDFYSFDTNNEMYIDAISFQDALGVDESSLSLFQAYPNPVTGNLQLSTRSLVEMVEVYDVLGHKVMSVQPGTLSPSIDFSSLASGSYFVKASVGNQSKPYRSSNNKNCLVYLKRDHFLKNGLVFVCLGFK